MKIQNGFSLIFLLLVVLSCSPSQRILEDRQPTSTPVSDVAPEIEPEIEVDDFAARLKQVQTGDFDFVYAFRRKDGDVFNSEDKKYLRENSPADVNQWISTGDKKVFIAGSNYLFRPENLDALKKRFKIEDYSTEKEEPQKDQNLNVNR